MKDTSNVLDRVMATGLCCDIHFAYWSGAKKLRPEDLGLEEGDIPEDAFSLGRRYLVPPEEIRQFTKVESFARRIVRDAGFPFPVGSAWFIPSTLLEEVDSKLTAQRVRYQEYLESFLERYGEIRESFLKEQEPVLSRLWEKVVSGMSRDQFIEYGLDVLADHYPTAGALRERFSFSWSFFNVSFGGGQSSYPVKQEQGDIRRKMMAKYQKQAATEVREWLGSVVATLRSTVAEAISKLSEAMKKKGAVRAATLASVTKAISDFRRLNFLGDASTERALRELERVLPDSASDIKGVTENSGQTLSRIQEALGNVAKVTDNLTKKAARSVVNDFFGAKRKVRRVKK
jgi:hypothetical protein